MLERFAHLIPGFRSYNTANHSYALSTALMAWSVLLVAWPCKLPKRTHINTPHA